MFYHLSIEWFDCLHTFLSLKQIDAQASKLSVDINTDCKILESCLMLNLLLKSLLAFPSLLDHNFKDYYVADPR